ncbi:Chromatin associated protein KTI12 [Penicillium chrysogenum]|uniref:Chromatin associated protein KTI12 n=1 Tax=Penicillium chrysogenum TaxID=5076 RepID=A0ABQ8X1A8_PENCH|nr:Chromatin associated protein KTI12 [Penicillium chrysogenum]KAJ5227732.1 Chromatin associated protein KTI12 [Penicillium chrysogenum]KAJ5284631.1 Chromatin associated protein KTI12 [Penicillium chrysogenum]KAJ5286539.1 Chromatin associated protein KTI12 [Penicillium chrysogenum]KAJ6167235.1 Chromatin associated protein KTI12 [Penicillium chrysogenum]
MPLVVLTGYPCSGLTHRANQLASLFEKHQDEVFAAAEAGAQVSLKSRYKVHVVASHDSSHPRIVYDHARTEKEARGVAYARAKRVLKRDSIVILDGMNYIKGWRYQLWCEAKAAQTTCCVVHVGTPVDQCVANNNARLRRDARKETDPKTTDSQTSKPQDTPASDPAETTEDTEEAYPPELLNNLIFRYEEPSTHSRWDKPLFTVPWDDPEPPVADIFAALTGVVLPSTEAPTETAIPRLTDSLASTTISDVASTATGTRGGGRSGLSARARIVPHQATVQAAATDSNAMYAMEKRTSAVVTAIRNFTQTYPSAEVALAQSNRADAIAIDVPETTVPILVPSHVALGGTTEELAAAGGVLALPRLQRLRRQWISLNRSYIGRGHGGGGGTLAADQIGDAFVRFLNAEFSGEVAETAEE